MKNRYIVTFVTFLAAVTALHADNRKLAYLIPFLYGPDGLKVDSQAVLPDGSTHSGHFNSSFQQSFSQFNIAMGSQLASVPVPSPASGFTYTFDPAVGVFNRSTQSFGPLLSDRAETIGKGKWALGFTYQRFTFDTLEGVSLDSIPAVFTHDDAELGGGRTDVVTTQNAIDISMDQFVSVLAYGLSDRIDVSVAIPVVHTSLQVTSLATIRRIGTADPKIHYFDDGHGGFGDSRTFSSSGSASGIGDITLRMKATAFKQGGTGLALGADVRLPTGDEENLLGSGAVGFKPFAALSLSYSRVSPHFDIGYQWNGKSVLAGSALTQTKGDLPKRVTYAIGADVGVAPRLTVAFDIIGQRVSSSPRLSQTSFQAANGSMFQNIQFQDGSFNETNAAVGFKLNAANSLLVDFNITFKLDDGGLRDKFTPLIGIEYTF